MLAIQENGTRVADLILIRDPSKDYEEEKDGETISFFGLDICWADRQPTSVAFAHFCTVGIGTIFGLGKEKKSIEKLLPKGEYAVKFYFIPVDIDDPKSKVEGSFKVRRMYSWKENGELQFFFSRGIPTIMKFSDKDEERVKGWVNFEGTPEKEKIWFDFAATVEPKSIWRRGLVKLANLVSLIVKRKKKK